MPAEGSRRDRAADLRSAIARDQPDNVIECVTDAVVCLDKNWRCTYVNREAGRLFECPPQDLIGKNISTKLPDDAKLFCPAYEQAMAEQKFVYIAKYCKSWHRWYENRIYPSPEGVSIFFHDVTEQKQAEEEARDSFELLQAQNQVLKLIAQGEPLHATLDALLRIIEAQNPGMLASVLLLDADGVHVRHGAAPSLPKSYIQRVDGEPIGPRAGSCGTAAYRREPVIVEDIATDPLWIDYRDLALAHGLRACWSTPIFDEERRVLGTFALYFGAPGLPNERHKKQIEMVTYTASIAIVKDRERQALVIANKRLTAAMAAGRIAIWERDLRTNRVVWSNQLRTIFGNSGEDDILTFEDFLQAVHADDRPRVLAAVQRAISQRADYDLEFRVVWPDGSVHWIASRGKADFDSNDQPICMRGVGLDITERKHIQEEIKAREVQLADAQRVANIGSYEWLPVANIVRWTDELFQIFGLPREEFRPTFEGYLERVHPQDRESIKNVIEQCVRDRMPFEIEERIVRPDGSVRWLLCQGKWLFDENQQCEKLVGTCQDTTARKESERSRTLLEEQLRQMQKMESVGRLAGGVAHDFNNLLSVIFGHVALARQASKPDAPVLKHIEQIQQAAERAAALTRRLLAFSRREIIQPTVLDLNVVVKNLSKMMVRLIREHILLRIIPAPFPARIRADLGQIDQILMNLVVNAVDAMPKGGKIFIETANAELDEDYAKNRPSVRPGRYVMLSVTDTGVGMDPQTMSQIFEPFFTTKPAGQGTGLGLSMVYGAVEQNKGHIAVYSQVGKGTTFKIYFPSVDEVPRARSSYKKQLLRKGGETILLVEDDEALRELTGVVLVGEGYKVLEAKSGAVALAAAQEYPDQIHLVITDVMLPDVNGVELVAQLKLHRPGLRVLYISGYPGDLLSHHGVLEEDAVLLPKPFTKADLIACVSVSLQNAA
jgi:two-component system, cell cycle sensor histidine kinase and response regulator CckA